MRKVDLTKDYHVICSWWRQHGWQAVQKEFLPTTGYIVDGICAGFLYRTDSKIAWLEFIVANKEAEKQVRDEGLNKLIEGLVKHADEEGFKAIFTSANHPKLMERYNKYGFETTDKNMTNMIRRM